MHLKNQRLKAWILLTWAVAGLACTTFFAGCNTVEGAGEDLERGSERVQDEIND